MSTTLDFLDFTDTLYLINHCQSIATKYTCTKKDLVKQICLCEFAAQARARVHVGGFANDMFALK